MRRDFYGLENRLDPFLSASDVARKNVTVASFRQPCAHDARVNAALRAPLMPA